MTHETPNQPNHIERTVRQQQQKPLDQGYRSNLAHGPLSPLELAQLRKKQAQEPEPCL